MAWGLCHDRPRPGRDAPRPGHCATRRAGSLNPSSGTLAALTVHLGTAFDALETYIGDAEDIGSDDTEFARLDDAVSALVAHIADTAAPDLDGLRIKARLLLKSLPVREDENRSIAIGASLARDVLRLLEGSIHG